MTENEQNVPKKKPKKRPRCFARYDGEKTQICRVKGQQRIINIYLQRGFVEVSEEEFNRIWKIKREELK